MKHTLCFPRSAVCGSRDTSLSGRVGIAKSIEILRGRPSDVDLGEPNIIAHRSSLGDALERDVAVLSGTLFVDVQCNDFHGLWLGSTSLFACCSQSDHRQNIRRVIVPHYAIDRSYSLVFVLESQPNDLCICQDLLRMVYTLRPSFARKEVVAMLASPLLQLGRSKAAKRRPHIFVRP
jgi:hypothetical protein